MLDYLLVIPARYQSTRLPGKPLIDICGEPMLVRTYNCCRKAGIPKSKIIVATDDNRIIKLCNQRDIQVLLTSQNCLTGTDRVKEVSDIFKAKTYINVQGDEPLFNHYDLLLLLKESKKNPELIINGENGFLYDPNDFDSLVSILEFLLSSPQEFWGLSQRTQKQQLPKQFHAETMINSFLKIID